MVHQSEHSRPTTAGSRGWRIMVGQVAGEQPQPDNSLPPNQSGSP